MSLSRYLVLTRRTADFEPAVLAPHRAFLAALRAQGRIELSGPFTDGSGGAYLLRAESLERARELVAADPLAISAAASISVHEWTAT